ncbi:MAG: alpha/beta hydrolase [Chloroflexi bacterium]|nr:alpha/beta hydrolase [Chloroflexota bacterium]
MATFVLIPGAGGHAAYWNGLIPELESRGHHAVAVDIEENDPSMDLHAFAAAVEAAMGDYAAVIVVAQSLGGFTAPMIHKPVRMIVLLNAMIPRSGESPNDWWGNTGSGSARREADLAAGRDPEFDVDRHFFHDLPDDARAELLSAEAREPSAAAMGQPCDFARWPAVPTKVLIGRDDRLFPAEFQRRVAKDRLALDADEIPGGHLVALSNPSGLADMLVAYAAQI